MSRAYHMQFKVAELDPSKIDAISDLLGDEWVGGMYSYVSRDPYSVSWDGESSLYGGETEEEFADRIAVLIWQVNQGFCMVEIVATYLENLPCETYTRDQDFYEKVKVEAPEALELKPAEPVKPDEPMKPLELLPGFVEALKTTSRTEALYRLVEEKGLDLDDYVHQLKSTEASDINNEGSRAQLDYMIEVGGVAWVEDTLGNYK